MSENSLDISNQLDITDSIYQRMIITKNITSVEVEKYGNIIKDLYEIKGIINPLIELSKINPDNSKKIYNVINSVSKLIDIINSNMETIINESLTSATIKSEISEEQSLIKIMMLSLQSTGEISEDLMSQLINTRNSSLERYVLSILGEEGKNTNKYPWLFYTPDIKDIDDIDMTNFSHNEKFVYNFRLLTKQIYIISKLNIRNINMLRIADIDRTNKNIKTYKDLLEKLLYINIDVGEVDTDFVFGKYENLETTYDNHNTLLKNLLGDPLYKRFVYHIINDGESSKSKIIKTETLLKYLLIASKNITIDTIDAYKNFFSRCLKIIEKCIENNINISELDIILLKTSNVSKDDIKKLHNSKNNIYTYVKIRSDDPIRTNQRFKTSIDKNRQIMYMGYDPYPDSIYKKSNNNTFELQVDFEHFKNKVPYPHNYLFGPFTYIFKTSQNNTDISNSDSMIPLIDKLKNGKSVCIIGYGASGSGKTSSLIYAGFEKEEKNRNGILINFCDKRQIKDKYDTIRVSFVELQSNNKHDDEFKASNDYKIIPIPENEKGNSKYTENDINKEKYYTPHYFGIKNNIWKYNTDINEKLSSSELKDYETDKLKDVKINSDTLLGDFIVNVLDNKRVSYATTNNPVSSRSHMVIFVTFLKSKTNDITEFESEQPSLIICDFAGVENKFECENKDTLDKFNIMYNNTIKDELKPILDYIEKGVDQPKKYNTHINFENIDKYIEHGLSDVLVTILTKIKREFTIEKEGGIEKVIQNIKLHELPSYSTRLKAPIFNILNKLETSLRDVFQFKYNDDNMVAEFMQRIWINEQSKPVVPSNISKGNFSFVVDEYEKNKIYTTQQGLKSINKLIGYVTSYKNFIEYIKGKQELTDGLQNEQNRVANNICKNRVKEGQFINDSLEELRNFISYFITKIQNKGKIMNPKFIDECAPIQCNPNYEDCFGLNNEQDNDKDNNSSIIREIRKKICCNDDLNCNSDLNCDDFKDITLCIFNVINLTQKANNPPPIPYIDISSLVNEQLRLESIDKLYVFDNSSKKINNDNTSTLVSSLYLKDLENNILLNDKYPGSVKGTIRSQILRMIKILLDEEKNPPLIEVTLTNLKNLIEFINKINAVTTVGTMEFTDMISKYGLNKNVCNYKYSDKLTTNTLSSGKEISDIKSMMNNYTKFIKKLHTELYNENITTK
jgi:hypothetical protein